MSEPSKWAITEAQRWLYRHENPFAVAAGMAPPFSAETVSSLALALDAAEQRGRDAARSGEQRLRAAIEDEAREQDRKALRADYHDDHADGPLYHSYAARVLRSLLSDAPEAGREGE